MSTVTRQQRWTETECCANISRSWRKFGGELLSDVFGSLSTDPVGKQPKLCAAPMGYWSSNSPVAITRLRNHYGRAEWSIIFGNIE